MSPKFGCYGSVSEEMAPALVEWYLWWTLLKAISYKGHKLSVQSKGSCSSSKAPSAAPMRLTLRKWNPCTERVVKAATSCHVHYIPLQYPICATISAAHISCHQQYHFCITSFTSSKKWHSAKVPKRSHHTRLTSLRYDITFLSWSGWSEMPCVDSCTDGASCVEHGRMKRLSNRQAPGWVCAYSHVLNCFNLSLSLSFLTWCSSIFQIKRSGCRIICPILGGNVPTTQLQPRENQWMNWWKSSWNVVWREHPRQWLLESTRARWPRIVVFLFARWNLECYCYC